MEVKVNLSENAFENISFLATLNKQSVGKIIEDAVSNHFAETVEMLKESIKFCTDEEVLDLANLKMTAKQDKRFSILLAKQRESEITSPERKELRTLMQIYETSTLRKAIGIGEAIKRGLIKTPDDLK